MTLSIASTMFVLICYDVEVFGSGREAVEVSDTRDNASTSMFSLPDLYWMSKS